VSSTLLTPEQTTATLPDHLIHIEGQPWALWRWFAVRGTGFPVGNVLDLAAPTFVSAVDQLLQLEDEIANIREQVLDSIREELDRISERRTEEDRARVSRVLKALHRFKAGKSFDASSMPADAEALLQQLDTGKNTIAALQPQLDSAFKTETARISDHLHHAATAKLFREAVIWQNRHALHGSIEAFLRLSAADKSRGTERRKREALIARYLQRYSVKNDTIGFFGPVCWARFTDESGLTVEPGPALLAERNTYFEGWCLDTLAKRINRDKSFLPWLAPRRVPFVSVEGSLLYFPPRPPVKLSPPEAAVLKACDGALTAREIAREMIASRKLETEEAVFSVLRVLRNKGAITWALEIPLELHPEKTLRRMLERVDNERLRRPHLDALNQLESARDAVSAAAGDPEKLDRAMGDLENLFTRLTGVAATRSEGALYAGRTLVYEDCRRDLRVEIGNDVVQSLGRPLSLVLFIARWFSFELAAMYRAAFEKIYDEQTRRSGSKTMEFVEFWSAVRSLLVDVGSRPADVLLQIFEQRWSEVLAAPAGERRLQYSSEELRPRILNAFPAPGPGWKSACYHSPDIMVAAASLDDIRRGNCQFVLGEVHGGMNTLGFSVFLAQHPHPEELFRAAESDLPEPLLVPVISKYLAPEQTVRVFLTLIPPKDYRLEIAPDSRCPENARVFSLASFLVERKPEGLVLRTRDGGVEFDLIEAFGVGLSDIMVDAFKVLSPRVAGRHPRVTIDNLVLAREAWGFAPEEIAFVRVDDQRERFVAARRWARAQKLPRFVFVKAPVEEKPFYLDFDSPVYVDIFAKTVRQSIESDVPQKLIVLSEMLPGPDQAWLPDAEGNRYSCELRMVAYDTRT
jgi:hypothetical protein